MACVPRGAGGRRCRGGDPQPENRQGNAFSSGRSGGGRTSSRYGRTSPGGSGDEWQRAGYCGQLGLGGFPELPDEQGREKTQEGQETDTDQGGADRTGYRQENRIRQDAPLLV